MLKEIDDYETSKKKQTRERVTNLEYLVSSKEKTLYPLIEQNDVLVVAGSFFGDEGKGKTVDAIARHHDVKLIMRSNSGENAGHTIINDNKRYIFHLAPSGLLIPGKINLIGSECVMDPINFMQKEIKQLVDNGIDYSNLFVGNVQIVTPYHKLMDLVGNPNNSSTLKGMSPVHASKVTKRGLRMDNLFNSRDDYFMKIEKDLHTYKGLLKQKNYGEKEILRFCQTANTDKKRVPNHVLEFLEAENKMVFLCNLYDLHVAKNPLFPQRTNSKQLLEDTLRSGGKVLLEGPQSYFLSNSIETHWGSSTSANTTAAGIMAAAGYNFTKYKTVVINVHKTPASSRVGIGANPSGFVPQDYFSSNNIDSITDLEAESNKCYEFNEFNEVEEFNKFDWVQKDYFTAIGEDGLLGSGSAKDEFLEKTDVGDKPEKYINSTVVSMIEKAMAIFSATHHGEFGATTGKPRVCGMFDCVAHAQVNSAQGPYLTISAMDRGDDYDKVGLVIGYKVELPEGETMISNGTKYQTGDIVKCGDQLPNEQVLYHCKPIIKVMPGWKSNPIAFDKRQIGDPLPKQVQDYVGAIEHFTGAEVVSIGNGADTENLIYLKKSIN